MLLESKLDKSFPEGKFLIIVYSAPYRTDRNCCRGRLMLFAREEIQLLLLSAKKYACLRILY